ncbi:redoxin domain-containing protein [Paenibacillus thalictri]|uniref:Redoxin domain-containing protein n=1 Tax=Paenibacillus thalictri TaxID=2527873 RepID=A0A4Q9DRQ0_9BACL|nr:redoxin domain-containing protein [Paenibacillus thalictri]TBL79474.1 redoxin domain-containing protein [Paenibacillus thalictri]
MIQQLQPGNAAPLFQTVDHNGSSVRLEQYRGRKMLLAFFRNSACALCNLRMHRLISRYPQWREQGLDVIAFFESPETSLHAYAGKQDAPFPLIADPQARIYNLYGVEVSEQKVQATISDTFTKSAIAQAEAAGFKLTHEEGSNFHRIPAEFLIDEDGILRVVHYNRLITDDLPLETIDRFASQK